MGLTQETIAALATAAGPAGVAVVRISGPAALEVASRCWSGRLADYATHTAHYGHVLDGEGRQLDSGLLMVMRAPRSFTGEETVEIQCHGGLVARRVLHRILEAGARAAQPGEFTQRAYLNGKMDLAQAEAVQELICAQSEAALQCAREQLQGRLSDQVRAFQSDLIDAAAILEAWVDFPEEGLEFAPMEQLTQQLEAVTQRMELLAATYEEGRRLREGVAISLVGGPNVGKSSLMNALLGYERAIVTPIAGTTRDTLEADLLWEGLPVRLVDTAGIRETDDPIEAEGVRRSQQALERSDLLLWVNDVTQPDSSQQPDGRVLVVWNKCDLPHTIPDAGANPSVCISAHTGMGLDELRRQVHELLWKGQGSAEQLLLTHERHRQALDEAIASMRCLIDGLRGDLSPEFCSYEMRSALKALGQIIGMDIGEEIISAIFSKFCLGK
jgi:tRNA modification GTPase